MLVNVLFLINPRHMYDYVRTDGVINRFFSFPKMEPQFLEIYAEYCIIASKDTVFSIYSPKCQEGSRDKP